MKGKTEKTLFILAVFLLLVNAVSGYSNQVVISDGNVLMYGGVILKPNLIHTYTPQMDARYMNITLDNGTLGLSKGSYAYDIACATEDNISISIHDWFYGSYVKTSFTPIAESESVLSFVVNVRARGEPDEIRGTLSTSYDDETTTLSLTCASGDTVFLLYLSIGQIMFEWYTTRTLMWLGIAGGVMCVVSPVLAVYFLKSKEYEYASIIALIGVPVGLSLMIGWLWS